MITSFEETKKEKSLLIGGFSRNFAENGAWDPYRLKHSNRAANGLTAIFHLVYSLHDEA